MIKIGIVGMGRMGMSHCAILNANPDVKLAALCEPAKFVAKVFERYAGFKTFKDYEKMVNEAGLDAVVITTPTKFHAEMVQYALERNLHVFVEKPFCLTPEKGRSLSDLAGKKKLVNQVGYHNRFIGTFREAKRLIEVGAIGEVYHVLGEAYGPVVLKEKGKTWRSDSSEGGGCLYDYATHVVNLVQYIFQTPTEVSGSVLQPIFSKGVDDAVYSTLYFDEDASGQLAVNWSDGTYRKMSTQINLLGKKGKIIVDAQELKVYLQDKSGFENYEQGWNMRWITDLAVPVGFYLRGEEYSAQLEYFIQCIKEGITDNINSFASASDTDQVASLIKQDAGVRW